MPESALCGDKYWYDFMGIDFFQLRDRISRRFEELDKEAGGTVCRTCGRLADDEDEWIPEAYTAIPIVVCDECWDIFMRKYPYEEYPDDEMIKRVESFLRSIHETVLNQCGMSVLIPSDEKGWHTLFFMAHQIFEEQGWVSIGGEEGED